MKFKVYVSAAWERMVEAREVAKRFSDAGHEVVSTWHEKVEDIDVSDPGATEVADRVFREIEDSEIFVCLTEKPGTLSRGNRHVETGFAMGIGLPVLIVGKAELLLHMASFARGETLEGWLAILGRIREGGDAPWVA